MPAPSRISILVMEVGPSPPSAPTAAAHPFCSLFGYPPSNVVQQRAAELIEAEMKFKTIKFVN